MNQYLHCVTRLSLFRLGNSPKHLRKQGESSENDLILDSTLFYPFLSWTQKPAYSWDRLVIPPFSVSQYLHCVTHLSLLRLGNSPKHLRKQGESSENDLILDSTLFYPLLSWTRERTFCPPGEPNILVNGLSALQVSPIF